MYTATYGQAAVDLFSYNWCNKTIMSSSIWLYKKAVSPDTTTSFGVHFVFRIDFGRCANLPAVKSILFSVYISPCE